MKHNEVTVVFCNTTWKIDVREELAPCPKQMKKDIEAFEKEKEFRENLKIPQIIYKTFSSKMNIK